MENLVFNKHKYVFASIPSISLIGDSVESNRNKQINLLLNELNMYNILIKDLVSFQLKESDRNMALNIAYYISENDELIKIINRKQDLPIAKLNKLTRIKHQYIEKYRDYIIVYYIILTNPNYMCIQDYFRIRLKEDNNIKTIASEKRNIHKGLVIQALKRHAYILTSMGEFLKIKINQKINVGEIAEGNKKKTLTNYRIHICILLFILILIGSGIVIEYQIVKSTVVIQTTSNIVLRVNKFDKVIYASSPTEKGTQLVRDVNIVNKDIDQAVAKIFEGALDNKMLDINKETPSLSKETLIIVSGQALKYGKLIETNKFITENNIPIFINNAGNQQRLPQYLSEDQESNEKK
jgi:hypothetical protein